MNKLKLCWDLLLARNYVVFIDFAAYGNYRNVTADAVVRQLRQAADDIELKRMQREIKEAASNNRRAKK